MFCCSAPPACSSTPLRPSVHYPIISLGVNIMYIQTFCGHLNVTYIIDQTYLYRVEVRLELNGANACLIVGPPPLYPSHSPTPPPSRWPALTTKYPPSPSFSSFDAACVKLCCFLLPRWSETSVSAVSSSLKSKKYKDRFAVNMNIKSNIIFADTVDALTATFAV